MKKLTLDEWEKKYIVGPVDRFDQKYTMFSRPLWDSKVKGILEKWAFKYSPSKEMPGYTLQDQALRVSVRQGILMGYFHTAKPSPSSLARVIAEKVKSYGVGKVTMASPPPEGEKIDISDPKRLTRDIKNAAIYFGADLVGICKLDRRFIYTHTYQLLDSEYNPQEVPEEYQYAIVMGFGEDYNMLKYFPTYIADAETSYGYSRMAITNHYMTKFIQFMGYKAIDCTTNDVAMTIPMAMQAGFGELGRNGLLVTPEYGPRVRVSKVLTDLPLVPDTPIDFGVTEFCSKCERCAETCPSHAIIRGERITTGHNVSNVTGELKWPINAERCIGQWAAIGKPCTICIGVCPFNKPGNWFHWSVRWLVDNVRWADSFYVRMDKLLGYGKPAKADDFWDKWQPLPSREKRVRIS